MQISNSFPELTKGNTFRVTVYTIAVGGLFFWLLSKSQHQVAKDTLDNLAEQFSQGPDWLLFLIGSVFILSLLAGTVLIAIYAFFINHEAKLKKSKTAFHNFYFTLVLWLAILISIQLFIRVTAIFFRITLDNLPATIVSVFVTLLINSIAFALMYHYLHQKKKEKFFTWLKKLLLPQELRKSTGKLVTWGILAFVGFIPIIITGSLINQYLLGLIGKNFPPQPIIEFSLQNQNMKVAISLFILITIIAPFFEEIIMRGLVFRGLLKISSPSAAMIFSGIIFGFFHFNIFAFLPIVLIGTLFAWLYHRTGSLIPSIIAHSLFNGITFILLEVSKVG